MPGTTKKIDAFLGNVSFPLLLMSAVGLHVFTMVIAYQLAAPGPGQYLAALLAFVFFPVSEAVVAYYSWRTSGSMVNGYSVWVLLWLALLFATALLMHIGKRLARDKTVS